MKILNFDWVPAAWHLKHTCVCHCNISMALKTAERKSLFLRVTLATTHILVCHHNTNINMAPQTAHPTDLNLQHTCARQGRSATAPRGYSSAPLKKTTKAQTRALQKPGSLGQKQVRCSRRLITIHTDWILPRACVRAEQPPRGAVAERRTCIAATHTCAAEHVVCNRSPGSLSTCSVLHCRSQHTRAAQNLPHLADHREEASENPERRLTSTCLALATWHSKLQNKRASAARNSQHTQGLRENSARKEDSRQNSHVFPFRLFSLKDGPCRAS